MAVPKKFKKKQKIKTIKKKNKNFIKLFGNITLYKYIVEKKNYMEILRLYESRQVKWF